MTRFRLPVASLALAAATLAACGGDGDSGTPPAPTPPAPAPAAATVTLSGRLTAPDATTPIANALVYVKDSSTPSTGTAAGPLAALACGTPPTASWASACTAADGTFSFAASVPASPVLVAVKGAFTQEKALVVNGDGPLVVGNVALAAASGARLAVVTGAFDRMQDVLAKLGYGQVANGQLVEGTETFVQYLGSGNVPVGNQQPAAALFTDADGDGKADIHRYAVVFFNCGLDQVSLASPQNIATLRAYVEAGGRIYVSDQAYDIVEQTFPAYVDFEGSDGVAADQPEEPGAALAGDSDIQVNAAVDPALDAWLQGVTCQGGPCVTAGRAHVEGFLGGWAVMAGLHPAQQASAKVWATGPVTFGGQATPVDRPLTVSFGVGQGRVTYTSYHAEPDLNTAGFLPQERILQFLVFEL